MSILDFLAEFSYRRVVWGTLLIGLCSGGNGNVFVSAQAVHDE